MKVGVVWNDVMRAWEPQAMRKDPNSINPPPQAALAIGDVTLDTQVLLAPMAGITDLPFRRMVMEFGAGLVTSEMIASQDMLNQKPAATAKAELGLFDGLPACAVQIAGRDPQAMAQAAAMAADLGATIIDINLGCPAKKVTSGSGAGACGAALLREPDRALRVIAAVREAVAVPVTIKTRLAWDDDDHPATPVIARAADLGIAAVTVHGRTRAQFYKGQADWTRIACVTGGLALPVIANGDITDAPSARAALAQSGAAGVMVGRGAQGRPWLLAQIAAQLRGQTPIPTPQGRALADIVARHYAAILSFYGTHLGGRIARKHLGWYADAAGLDPVLRQNMVTTDDPRAVFAMIASSFAEARAA